MNATLGATGTICDLDQSAESRTIATARVTRIEPDYNQLPTISPTPDFEDLAIPPSIGSRLEIPTKIERVGADRLVELTLSGAICDIDDTCLQHSGYFIHDSATGRYALATNSFLKEHGVNIPLTEFAGIWDSTFSKCLGISHGDVCKLICKTAWDLYGDRLSTPLTEETAKAFDKAVTATFLTNFKSLMSRVEAMPKVKDLLDSCREIGVPVAACTASPRNVILPSLAQNGILNNFRVPTEVTGEDGHTKTVYSNLAVVAGAVKKDPNGIFSGSDVQQAAKLIGQSPSSCVMFGDTMSDVGAAKMAGVPVVVIRLSAPHDEVKTVEVQARLAEEFRRAFEKAAQKNPSINSGLTVYLVDDFSQVTVRNTNATAA